MYSSLSTHAQIDYDAPLQAKDAKTDVTPAVQWTPCSQMAADKSLKQLFVPSENDGQPAKQKGKDARMLDLDLAFYGTAEARPLTKTRSNSIVRRHSATSALASTSAVTLDRRTNSVNNLVAPTSDAPKAPAADSFMSLLKRARAHTTAKRKADDMCDATERRAPSKVAATSTSTAARGNAKGKGKATFLRTHSASSFGVRPQAPAQCTYEDDVLEYADSPTPSSEHHSFSRSRAANSLQSHSSSSSIATPHYTSGAGSQASTECSSPSQGREIKVHPILTNTTPLSKQKPPQKPAAAARPATVVQSPLAATQAKGRLPALGMRPRATYTFTKPTSGNQRGFKPPLVKHPSPPPVPPSPPPAQVKAGPQHKNEDETDPDTSYDFDTSFDMEVLEEVMKQYE